MKAKTFDEFCDEAKFDEAPHVRQVLRHLWDAARLWEREAILVMGKTLRDDHCDNREQAKGVQGYRECISARR